MKNSLVPFPPTPWAAVLAAFLILLGGTPSALAAGTNYFALSNPSGGYDLAGNSGTTGDPNAWSQTTENAATAALGSYVYTDGIMIGTNESDFDGDTFTINVDEATSGTADNTTDVNGGFITINSTNVIVTLTGSANEHLDVAANLWTVAAGSTLIEDISSDGSFNFNSENLTLAGGGTFNFETMFGANDSKALIENMTGAGTVILSQSGASTRGVYTGGYMLTNGTLQFLTAFALANAFKEFSPTSQFAIFGGNIDNTSGSAGVLNVGTNGVSGANYLIGGSFTFNGSSSLDFGSANVTNTGNNVITITNTLAIGGAIKGAGNSLTLPGPGTLMLYGNSTNNGSLLVLGGTLLLTNTGSLANGSPVLVSNATFDISGLNVNYTAATPITLTAGSTFNVSNVQATAISTLSITNSVLNFSGESTATANVTVTNLNVGGTANVINITFLPLVTSYPQTFPLLKAGTVNGTLNFALGTLPASPSTAYAGSIVNVPGSGAVNLVLTAGPAPVRALVWSGLDAGVPNGTWDVQNTPTWLSGGVPTTFNQLDFVTFNDTAAGLTTISIAGGLTPGSLTVSNNALPYTFTGNNLADGTTSLTLTKKGTGTLLLQESGDSFSGGINVSGGTVIVDNNSSGINGGVTIGAGGTIQEGQNDTGTALPSGTLTVNGTLAFNCADSPITVSEPIVGDGLVEELDTNLVLLSDAGTSSGNWGVTIMNGTVQAADNTALGSLPGGAVTITNGGTFDVGANTTANNANFGAKQFYLAGAGVGGNGAIINSYNADQEDAFEDITLTANATFGGAYRWDMRNNSPLLNLAGFTLTKTNANQISIVSPHVTGGSIVIQQGTLSFEATPNFDAGATNTITVNSGGYVGEYEDTLGSFTRSIVLNGGGVKDLSPVSNMCYLDAPILLTANSSLVPSAGTEVFNGVISDGGNGYGLTISGAGTNALSATNTYSGGTYVSQSWLMLTNHGSIASSVVIVVTNGAVFDVSTLAVPFSGPNALVLGDDSFGAGTFNLGATLVTNLNYLSLSNAVLNLAGISTSNALITVTNLNLGDGGASSTINIANLPVLLTETQIVLIKYTLESGSFQIYAGNLPNGYGATIVNNTANHSIDLQITQQPAGLWTGADSVNMNNYWSDNNNWNGDTALTGSDPLNFNGSAGLINTNDTSNETANYLAFLAGSGAFTLNGNPITLNGNINNYSSQIQTIKLGVSLAENPTFNAGTTGLVLDGGITNTSSTWYTIHLQGTNGVLAGPLQSSTAGYQYNLEVQLDAIAGVSNSWSIVGNNTSYLTNLTVAGSGSVTFGTGSDSPTLVITNVFSAGGPLNVGTTTNATSYFTMNSGTLILTNANNAPVDLGQNGGTGVFNLNGGSLLLSAKYLMIGDSSSTGVFNQKGGTVTTSIANDIILGNSINNSAGTVNLSGGTFNALANNDFFLGFRGVGIWNISGSGLLEVQTLNMTRNSSDSANASGTLNLNGGTVSTYGEFLGNAATGQTGAINFNGGVLLAGTNSATFISPPSSPSVLTTMVKAGGAVINDGGFAIGILTPLVHDTTLGATADGGLTKLGSGTLTLTATNTYTGGTLISVGTLALSGTGSISNLASITIASGATLSASGLNNSTLTLAAGQTLFGAGMLTGNLTTEPGSWITPATNTTLLGTLTVSAIANLGGTNYLKINKALSPSNDVVSASTVIYGGTLVVTNVNAAYPLALGDSFQLFNAGGYSGSFAATSLPVLGAGLQWNWNPANGTLSVVTAGPGTFTNPTGITSFSLTGNGNVVITGTNGQSGDAYYLLETTNLTLPISQWTPVATNVLNASGSFTFIGTNVVTPGGSQQFYRLSNTNN
jgi:autotransporter-associated beta strand protein